MPVKALDPAQLCQRCDPAQFKFKTTEDLEHLTAFIGQPRAIGGKEYRNSKTYPAGLGGG